MRINRDCTVGAEKPPATPARSEVEPDAIVATDNGKKMTADEVRKMVAGIPAQVQQAFTNDPKQFMKEYAWYMNLQATAEKQGLAEQSPYKEILEFQRMMTLVQAEWNDEYLRRSKSHPRSRRSSTTNIENGSAKLRRSSSTFRSPVTAREDEAKAKAEKVVQQARGGVDFVKLVKEYSQDPASAGQNGDIGMPVRKTTTQIPETMRNAILALKAGSGQRSGAPPERLLRIQGRIGWRLTVRESQRRDLQRAERRGFQRVERENEGPVQRSVRK